MEIEPDDSRLGTLLELNRRPISLQVKGSNNPHLGHQYLFFVLPFGEVSSKDIRQDLLKRLTLQLALMGFKTDLNDAPPPILTVEASNVQLTAYDLFFVREIYCDIALDATLMDLSGLEIRASIKSSQRFFRGLAFQDELEKAYKKTLDGAIMELFRELGLR